jgi:hypothetical protein
MTRRYLSLVLLLASSVVLAQEKAVPEYTMKAAYLYNFAQLTDWPARADSGGDFTICVAGQDEVADALADMAGRSVQGRALRPVRIQQTTDAVQCQLLYVGDGSGQRGMRMIDTLRGKPVLTVTDDPRVAREGAMLLIVPDGKRLAFEVNRESASRAQLKFSSKLLRLASRVSGE